MKRRLGILLVLACVLTCAACGNDPEASSEATTTGTIKATTTTKTNKVNKPEKSSDGLTFLLSEDGGSYTVVDIGSFAGTELNIPETYQGKPVTAIAEGAFENCTALTDITIPSGVTSIGSNAFRNTAYYNDDDHWQDGVLYIGEHLIEGWGLSGAYTISDGTRCIADAAFCDCTGLTGVIVPDSVTDIGHGAFQNCSGLTGMTIGTGVTRLGTSAFRNCSKLTQITLPESVISIGGGAFAYCAGLTDIVIPEGVAAIGSGTFWGCSGVVSITLPETVTTIGNSAFGYCGCLKNIEFHGTMEQWNRVRKGGDWNSNTGFYTVCCVDGNIGK